MKLEAYISIENTVGRVMLDQWQAEGKKTAAAIADAVGSKKFNDAYDLIRGMNLYGSVTDAKPKLRELMVSAMLFGAGHIVPVKYTNLMKTKKLPEELDFALQQLEVMVETNGTDLLTRRVTALVHEQEQIALDDAYAVKKAEFDLADALNAAVMGTGKAVFDVGANLTTSRLVSFGFLDEAVFNQVTTYQVTEVLDTRTCPVCQVMHGKSFSVSKEHNRVLTVLRIQDPNELREAAPWPKQNKAAVRELRSMSEEEMQDKGFGSPPYHPGCRGILQMQGTVTENILPPLPKLPLLATRPATAKPIPVESLNATETRLMQFGYDPTGFTKVQIEEIAALLAQDMPLSDAVDKALALA